MQAATSAPLIERSIERATGIVYNITGGSDLTLQASPVGCAMWDAACHRPCGAPNPHLQPHERLCH